MDNSQRATNSWIKRHLAGRFWPLIVAALAVLLTLPSLWAGWEIDDLVHRKYLLEGERFPLDLYGFLKGDVDYCRMAIKAGVVPWWTLEELHVAFFRPIASFTCWLDYELWPDSAFLMHAHSLAWLAVCVVVVSVLYRRMMGAGWIAGLAALLFAIDDAHFMPAMWIANRNVLPALLFAVLTILVHDKWRRDGWKPGAFLGPLFMLASLCSAEAGVATVAYLIAHIVCLDKAPWRQRLVLIGPYVVVAFAWRIVYLNLGYGTFGSGFYTDPGSEPIAFLGVLLERAPILMALQWSLIAGPVDGLIATFGPNGYWTAAGCIVTLIIAALLYPVVRASATARFWALGMLISLPPVCATIPMARLNLFMGIGAFALLAEFLAHAFDKSRTRRVTRIAAWFLLVIHIVIPPIVLPRLSRQLVPPDAAAQFYVHFEPDERSSTIVFVNSPSVFHGRHSPGITFLNAQSKHRYMRFLGPSMSAVTLNRTDEYTLVVAADRPYLSIPLDNLFRSPRHPMPVGTRVTLIDLVVEILRLTDDGRPVEVKFSFDKPLEDPAFAWVCWRDGRYRPFDPPAVGESVTLEEPVLKGSGL